jgi:class 3 adenylate cyclase/tetratricopeptide (TPR) repeat protein
MLCPKCSKANHEDANFCMKCAASLIEIEQVSEQKITRIEGERKSATIIFSDLSGYTAMTEKMDPENVKNLMGDIFEKAGRIVEKYQGTVERFFGDEIMILFGVPKAHEDDPIRAINTSIEIHELVEKLSPEFEKKYQTKLSMHTGINSGLVITGDKYIGKGRHGLTGDTINLAKRLTGIAKPGEIVIGRNTFQKADSHFVFDEMEPVAVKGKAEPVKTFKVISVKKNVQKGDKAFGRQISSKMVGRDSDLNKLELQVAKVINGQGSVINIIGEAGIGKSRLFAEFRKLEIIKKATLFEGKSISIGNNLPFHPITDFLKNYAQITEDDIENMALVKLESAIRGVNRDEADEIFPFIALLMGMTLSGKHLERVKGIEGESLEKLIFKSLRDLLISISAVKPLIIAMEDLHWADASSISLLESMFSVSQIHPILFINLFRPNFKETGEKIKNSLDKNYSGHFYNINLAPLDKDLSESLINNMLMIKGLPAQYKEKIIKRTGGNPFFMEEVVRSLIDQGAIIVKDDKFEITPKIDDIHIPGTINDLLTARIDRLEDKTRHLVKIASVVGRHFYHRIISRIATTIEDLDQRLMYLKDIQLIRQREHLNELEYIFKHALAQEAAYNSILLEKRKQIHLQVADSIEDIFKDRIHEFYGMLAMHYTRGENPEKAEHYLIKAGEEAMRSSASDEALKYYQEGLKLYLQSNKYAIDPEKAAMFEKNIALVFYNRSRFIEAIPHFDKVLEYWGIPTHPNRLKTLPIFFKNIFLIKTGIGLFKGQVPSKRDEVILNILFKFGFSLASDDLSRASKIAIYLLNSACKMNLSRSPDAVNVIMGFSAVIAITKLSYNLPFKLLQICYEKMDKNNIKNMIAYRSMHLLVCYYSGEWDKIEKIDNKLIKAACKLGELQNVHNYLAFTSSWAFAKGNFSYAQTVRSSLPELAETYDYDHAKLTGNWMKLLNFWYKREVNNIAECSDKTIELSRVQGKEHYEFSALGVKAETLIWLNHLEKAQKNIDKAEFIIKRHKTINPSFLWAYHNASFGLKIKLLKKMMDSKNKLGMEELKKDAIECSKATLKINKNYIPFHINFFKMVGELYWLINEQKTALKWWTKSIKIGEKLGARPDLSRTYFEVGKSLLSSESKYKELSGITAKEYLDKAKTMFEGMELAWDLNELERALITN